MSSQQIYVSIELGGETLKVGKLWFNQRGARQSAVAANYFHRIDFEYR